MYLWAKISRKPPFWPIKSKRGLLFTAQNLLIEEAFLTHTYCFRKKVDVLRKTSRLKWKKWVFLKKVAKKRTLISFYLALNWPLGFILLPIGVEFQVELHGTKKSTYQKSQNNETLTEDLRWPSSCTK